jgi:serine/threonine protein kinase/WD40 repeat protein
MTDRSLVEVVLDEQDSDWQAGEFVPVEDYLGRYPALVEDQEGLLDLIWNEKRWRDQLNPDQHRAYIRQEYLGRFPAYHDQLLLQFEACEDFLPCLQEEPCPEANAHVEEEQPTPSNGRTRAKAGRLINRPLGGDFVLEERIGGGGMGEVYRARQLSLNNKRVAVKILRPGLLPQLERHRFLEEQRVLVRLQQSHIVPILAAGEEEDLLYIVMQYINGIDLLTMVEALAREAAHHQHKVQSTICAKAAELHTTRHRERASPEVDRAPTVHHEADKPVAPPGVGSSARRKFPTKYYREVASLMIDVGKAIHHAHTASILHRDIKPGNIMLDEEGMVWVIDFGLAREEVGTEEPGTPPVPVPASSTGLTSLYTFAGTTAYMAPEQFRKCADQISDVWQLSATLYQLLTLECAFPGQNREEMIQAIQEKPPRDPGELVRNLPTDLKKICLKGLEKDPKARYSSAQAFADDLGRWLRCEPTEANPGWFWRLWLWMRRNALRNITFLCVAISLMAFIAMLWFKATHAKERQRVAEERKEVAEEHARELQREAWLQKAQRIQLAPHGIGWFDDIWGLVREVAKIREGDDVRDRAAASLAGLDARSIKTIESKKEGATYVGFDARGRLLIGWTQTGAKWWESNTDRMTPLANSAGMITLLKNGTPVQLQGQADRGKRLLVLRDLAKQKDLNTFPLPGKGKGGSQVWAVSTDGAMVAYAAQFADESAFVTVWHVTSGKELWQSKELPTALEFASTDKGPRLLAIGYADGRISLRAIPTGKEVAKWVGEETAIQSLVFGRDPRPPSPAPLVPGGGLLAAGHSGGTIEVWDLGNGIPRSYLRGCRNAVHSLAFSPDGMTLASAGRVYAKLWDIASGQLLLNLEYRNTMSKIAFSQDGTLLAVSSVPAHGYPGGVDVYELDPGRGVKTLRGLVGPIERTVFSNNGRLLAALSHNWQVAIWDIHAGHLLHILNVPKGEFEDNAGFAFSPDATRFAFSTFKEAGLWDVTSGKRLKTSPLPYGFNDQIVYPTAQDLILFRVETPDPKVRPYGSDPHKFPRICRMRNLLAKEPLDPIHEFRGFDLAVYKSVSSPNGRVIAAEGERGQGRWRHQIIVWDGPTGKQVWSMELNEPYGRGAYLTIDPTGRFIGVPFVPGPGRAVVELQSRKMANASVASLGPNQRYSTKERRPYGIALLRRRSETCLVNLGIDVQLSSDAQFNSQGSQLALSTEDGAVMVYNIERIRKNLTHLGVGW